MYGKQNNLKTTTSEHIYMPLEVSNYLIFPLEMGIVVVAHRHGA